VFVLLVCLAVCVLELRKNAAERPSNGRKNFSTGVAARGRNGANRNGSPAFRRGSTRDELLWSRENEGAISDC
jgi:hypothetical protein